MTTLEETPSPRDEALLRLTCRIVTAFVRNHAVAEHELADVIASTHAALRGLGPPEPALAATPKPAVPIRHSVTPEAIICLEDGRRFRTLKRHLLTDHKMTPADYREKWGLRPEYPMVAPNYAKERSAFAKHIGLGKSAGAGRPPRK
jgi:predicted transcriptional regulator